jgi:hypothetical protein
MLCGTLSLQPATSPKQCLEPISTTRSGNLGLVFETNSSGKMSRLLIFAGAVRMCLRDGVEIIYDAILGEKKRSIVGDCHMEMLEK